MYNCSTSSLLCTVLHHTICTTISHPPAGAVFQVRLLDNQAGAKTEQNGMYVFGKVSARCIHRRPFVAPARHQLWRYRAWKSARGGGWCMYTAVCGTVPECDLENQACWWPGAPEHAGTWYGYTVLSTPLKVLRFSCLRTVLIEQLIPDFLPFFCWEKQEIFSIFWKFNREQNIWNA